MRPKIYPLDPLVRVRRERVDVRARDLAKAIGVREAAERARIAAEAERAGRAEAAQRTRAAEAGALGRGELTAADLQRQGAWEARAQWDDEAQADAVRTAHAHETTTRDGEERARSTVAAAEGEAKVVTEHRSRWVAEGQRAADAAAEEEAAEVWRPRP